MAIGLVAAASLHGQQAPGRVDAAPAPARYDPNAILSLPSKSHPTGDAIVQPSVITIHAHDQLLADTLSDLANQCGADLGIVGSTEINDSHIKKVTLDVDKGSFWDAMVPLCKSAGIGPAPGPGQEKMLLVDRATGLGGGAEMAAQSGGILFIPQFAHIERLVDYDDRAHDQAALAIQILMIPEPKMQLVGGELDNWLDTCQDEKGNSLASSIARSSTGQISQSWGTLKANLIDLPEQGTRIKSIKGKVKLSVRTQSQILTIDNIMKNTAAQVSGNNSIQIVHTSSDPDMDTVKVSVVEEGAVTPALGQSRAVPEGITFLDQSGAMLPFSGANAGGGSGATTVTYGFITGAGANARHPTTLRWELTTQSKTIEVPFELHDLDLPIARPAKPAN
jgi:hypothetical protein